MKNFILLEQDDEVDFEILALQTNIENEVSFVYQFNKYFSTNFTKTNSLDLVIRRKSYSYSIFQFLSSYTDFNYLIYKNKPNTDSIQVRNSNEYVTINDIFELSPYLISVFIKFNYLIKLPKPAKNDYLYQKIVVRNPILSKFKMVDNEIIQSKKNILF